MRQARQARQALESPFMAMKTEIRTGKKGFAQDHTACCALNSLFPSPSSRPFSLLTLEIALKTYLDDKISNYSTNIIECLLYTCNLSKYWAYNREHDDWE